MTHTLPGAPLGGESVLGLGLGAEALALLCLEACFLCSLGKGEDCLCSLQQRGELHRQPAALANVLSDVLSSLLGKHLPFFTHLIAIFIAINIAECDTLL